MMKNLHDKHSRMNHCGFTQKTKDYESYLEGTVFNEQ